MQDQVQWWEQGITDEVMGKVAQLAGATWKDDTFPYEEFGRIMVQFQGNGIVEWNPLRSSEDAFQLMIALEAMVDTQYKEGVVAGNHISEVYLPYDDYYNLSKKQVVRLSIMKLAMKVLECA